MPDRHKSQPLRFRPPEEDRSRLLAYAEHTGRAVNAIVSEAIRDYLDKHAPAKTGEKP